MGDAGAVSANGTMTNCTFTDNTSTAEAGALQGVNNTLTNCTFTRNKSTTNGGALQVSEITATNCSFIDNEGKGGGALVVAHNDKVATFINCIFTGNKAVDGTGGAI